MFVAPRRAATRWHLVPLVAQLRGYTSLRGDVLAGVVIAALAVPQAMAYAQTAGLPVVAGLYGLVLPLAVYAALGSSRVLMTGPTTTAALMVAPVLAAVSDDPGDYPALAAMLALLVAGVFGLARLAGLGWLADYFSSAVLLGFLTGLGLTLIAGQIGVLVGVEVTGYSPLQQYGSFIANVVGGVHWTTVSIGVVSLLILLAGSRWAPRFPTLLALTVAMIALSWARDLAAEGGARLAGVGMNVARLNMSMASMRCARVLRQCPARGPGARAGGWPRRRPAGPKGPNSRTRRARDRRPRFLTLAPVGRGGGGRRLR